MNPRLRIGKTLLGLALACGLPCDVSSAAVARIEIESVRTPMAVLDGVVLTLEDSPEAAAMALMLQIGRVELPEADLRLHSLEWRCELTRGDDSAWACDGPLRTREGRSRLSASLREDRIELGLRQGATRIDATLSPDATRIDLRVVKLPLDWLQTFLARAWEAARLTAGTVDAELAIETKPRLHAEGRIALDSAGLDTQDGSIAAAGLHVAGPVEWSAVDADQRLSAAWEVKGGELLFGPFYVALPSTPIALEFEADGNDARWNLARFEWRDAEALALAGRAVIVGSGDEPVQEASLQLRSASASTLRARYLESLLATAGLAQLQLDGSFTAHVEVKQGRLIEAGTEIERLHVDSGDGRFATTGMSGDLAWTRTTPPRESRLHWDAARLHGIDIGAADVSLRSSGGNLALRAPVVMQVLGGRLTVPRFSWQVPAVDDPGSTLDIALSLHRLELAALSRNFGWPAFGGTLSGEIPAVTYAQQRLEFQGGLEVEVFDGQLDVGALVMERPFGVAPTLAADIGFDSLDLQPLTAAFGFGEISGRLDGEIRGLRLIDWEPVAFDARLRTDDGAKGPRRISQRAVKDLSSVGGAGIVAGLQGSLLRMFDTFGYARIGLRCKLANNVCEMGGIDSSGSGYTIVEGAGLPRITVVGHQRRVDWPVLLGRLKAATEGQTPIVQ